MRAYQYQPENPSFIYALSTQQMIHRDLIGPDISMYQDDNTTPQKVNFQKMKDAGADFVILRAGQNTWRDPDFLDYRAAVRDILPWGAYWFYDSRSSPESQAELFWSTVAEIPPLCLVGDYEERYGGIYTGWRNFKKFLIRLQELSKIDDDHLWIYSAFYYWMDHSPQDQPLELEFFKRYPYWHAQYTISSTLLIPKPWHGVIGQPIAHQFTDSGNGPVYGVESQNIDLNYLNMSRSQFDAYVNQTADVITMPFPGVQQIHGKRFGRRVYINIIDPSKVRFEVKNEDGFPSQLCKKYNASIAWNGDDWDRVTRRVKDNDEPSLIIRGQNLSIGNRQLISGDYHTSGLRYLVRNGQNQIPTDVTDPKYTERHARSISGLLFDGRFFHLTADGEWPDQGLLLHECAEIAREFNCKDAFDQGGGGDTVEVLKGTVVNVPDDNIGEIHYERKVPQTILVYSKETNMAYGTAREKLGLVAKRRNAPSRYGTDVGSLPASVTLEFVEVVPVQKQGTADKDGETWFKLPDNTYVNYQLRNSSGVLVDYFTILTQPSTEEPPADKSFSVTIEVEGYQPIHITGNLEPL